MQELESRQENRKLKDLVVEASHALARLDVNRLEQLALSCQALNRGLAALSPGERREFARQAHEASADMAVFARVLEATGSNLKVMQRLRELRAGWREYGESAPSVYRSRTVVEDRNGDH